MYRELLIDNKETEEKIFYVVDNIFNVEFITRGDPTQKKIYSYIYEKTNKKSNFSLTGKHEVNDKYFDLRD